MEEYIPKSALVAEIERRIKTNKQCMLGLRNLDYYQGKVDALNDFISFINTLEVKEMELEAELNKWRHNHFHGRRDKAPDLYCYETSEKSINWLKSLRSQTTWKPSDKQIEALEFAADCIVPAEFCFKRKELKGLLEQLKKLREV